MLNKRTQHKSYLEEVKDMTLDDAIAKAIGIDIKKAGTVIGSDLLATADEGAFLPKQYADEFIAVVREKNYCRGLFKEVTMTRPTFEIPRVTADVSVYLIGETDPATAITASEPTVAAPLSLSAKKLAARTNYSSEVDEDAKLAIVPFLKESMAGAMGNAEEKAIIQGKMTALPVVATDPRQAFTGLIEIARAAGQTVNAAGADISEALIEAARRGLGLHGRNVRDLVLLVNPYCASILRQLTSVQTVDKYGPNATILNGELGKVMGITIIETQYVPEGDDPDTPTAGQGRAVLVNKNSPIIGDRRKIKFETDKVISSDSRILVCTERVAFGLMYTAAVYEIDNLKTSLG